MALLQVPRLYEGVTAGEYGLGFWLAAVMVLLAVPMVFYYVRERQRVRPEPDQDHLQRDGSGGASPPG